MITRRIGMMEGIWVIGRGHTEGLNFSILEVGGAGVEERGLEEEVILVAIGVEVMVGIEAEEMEVSEEGEISEVIEEEEMAASGVEVMTAIEVVVMAVSEVETTEA